jgi:hypothetical protein
MKSSFDGRLIGFLSSLVSDFAEAKPALALPARTVHLSHNAILRLEKSSRIKFLEIKSGSAWLTGTPAIEDLILHPGERFKTGADWPYVIQALEPAEVILFTRSI